MLERQGGQGGQGGQAGESAARGRKRGGSSDRDGGRRDQGEGSADRGRVGGGSVREGRKGGSPLGGKVGGSQGGGCPVEGGGSSEEGTRLKGLQEPAETAGPATVDDVDNLQKRKLFHRQIPGSQSPPPGSGGAGRGPWCTVGRPAGGLD